MMRRPLCVVCALLCLLAALCAGLSETAGQPPGGGKIPQLEGKLVTLEGRVADCLISADESSGQVIYLQEADITGSVLDQKHSNFLPIHTDGSARQRGVICYTEEKQTPRLGSRIRIRGKVRLFAPATNPGEFDRQAYYRRQGYDFAVQEAVLLGESRSFSRLRQLQWELRQYLTGVLYRTFPKREAGVLEAMLLGNKKQLEGELKSAFQKANISHILSISGLHISLIGMGLFRLLKKGGLRLYPAAGIAFVLLLFYGGMTGNSVSTRRAVLMFAFYLGAQMSGRTYDMLTAIGAAAAFLVLPNPKLLADSGFGLSFSAVSGVAVLIPAAGKLKKPCFKPVRSRWEKRKEKLWDALLGGLCVSIATLPLILNSFYEWNLYSVPANLLVIPLTGILLPLALLVLVLGAVTGSTGWLFVPVCLVRLLLGCFAWIAETAAALPGGMWYPGRMTWWKTLGFALAAALFLWRSHGWKRRRGVFFLGLLTAFLLLPVPAAPQVSVLDVGQGECIYIRSGAGKNYLIDCGSTSQSDTGAYQVLPFLKAKGVRYLDAVFISHLDADHVNGLEAVLGERKGMVRLLVLPESAREDEALPELLDLARRWRVPVRYMKQGDRAADGSLRLECLFPAEGVREEDRNEGSLVLLMEMEGTRMLFTGDLGEAGERQLIEQAGEKIRGCDILKAGHHGSAGSSSQAFLEMVRPGMVLISCGRNNRYGHPAAETLERIEAVGSRYFVTAQRGALTVTFPRKGWQKFRVACYN